MVPRPLPYWVGWGLYALTAAGLSAAPLLVLSGADLPPLAFPGGFGIVACATFFVAAVAQHARRGAAKRGIATQDSTAIASFVTISTGVNLTLFGVTSGIALALTWVGAGVACVISVRSARSLQRLRDVYDGKSDAFQIVPAGSDTDAPAFAPGVDGIARLVAVEAGDYRTTTQRTIARVKEGVPKPKRVLQLGLCLLFPAVMTTAFASGVMTERDAQAAEGTRGCVDAQRLRGGEKMRFHTPSAGPLIKVYLCGQRSAPSAVPSLEHPRQRGSENLLEYLGVNRVTGARYVGAELFLKSVHPNPSDAASDGIVVLPFFRGDDVLPQPGLPRFEGREVHFSEEGVGRDTIDDWYINLDTAAVRVTHRPDGTL